MSRGPGGLALDTLGLGLEGVILNVWMATPVALLPPLSVVGCRFRIILMIHFVIIDDG